MILSPTEVLLEKMLLPSFSVRIRDVWYPSFSPDGESLPSHESNPEESRARNV